MNKYRFAAVVVAVAFILGSGLISVWLGLSPLASISFGYLMGTVGGLLSIILWFKGDDYGV